MENLHKTLTKIKASLLFFTLICVFVLLNNDSHAQSFVWEKSISGTGADKVTDVATDANGNSYVLGYSNQQITWNGMTYGSTSATNYFPYVIKYDKSGVMKWVHVPTGLPATYNITSCSIALDTSGRVIYSGITQAFSTTTIVFGPRPFNEATFTQAGGTEGFIVALDSTGAAQWVDRFGNSGAATVNWIALAFSKFDNSLIYGVSAATASSPLSDFYFFSSPYFGGSLDLGPAYLTGTQESWYGKINTVRGINANQNYRFGGNQYSKEWIEDIAVDSLGNVYLGCTYYTLSPNGYASDIYYNGGNTTIPGSSANYGLIIKLRFDLFYLGYARITAGADSRMKAIAVRPTGEVAYIFDAMPGYINGGVVIGGFNASLASPWQNNVLATGVSGTPVNFFSGKGISYDNNGNIWASVGGYGTSASYSWSYNPAYPSAAIGTLLSNPGVMMLKLNYSSGTSATWLDYRYIRESASNANSQGGQTTPGSMSISGNSIFLAGTHANAIAPSPLAALTTTATDLDGHLIKLGCEPAFTLQPSSAYACSVSTLTLATTVSDITSTFQWYKNGTLIAGATNDTLTLTNVTAADTGSYILYATNSCGTTASNAAIISFSLPAIAGLQAWYKFDNNTADSSGNGNDATASNAITPTTNRFNQSNTAYAFNGTSSSVTVPATLLGNAQGKSFSLWFKRTGSGVAQPLITYQLPTPGAWNPVAYIGTDNVLRGWLYQGGTAPWTSGTVIDTNWHYLAITTTTTNQTAYLDGIQVVAMTGTLATGSSTVLRIGAGYMGVLPGVPAINTYYFNGKIDDARFYNGTLTAAQISQLYTQNAGIMTDPVGQTVCAGNSVTFSITAANASSYQWKRNGVNISGANSVAYTDANVQVADTGSYTCTITNACSGQTQTSGVAYLSLGTGGTISTQPVNQTPCLGSAASFSIAVTGGSATYQWKKNNVNITGATSATYNITAAAVSDTGTYVCIATTSCGALTSTGATLYLAPATSITAQPQTTQVCPGATATFTVSAVGGGTLSYVWKHNSTTLSNGGNITGATTNSISISGVSLNDVGSYNVIITGTCGNATSTTVNLSMTAAAPVINQNPTSQSVCVGQTNIPFIAAGSGTSITYQWTKNGVNIAGATASTYTLPVAGISDSGSYVCIVSNPCSSLPTTAAHLTVSPYTTITTEPVATQTACTGSSASFSVTAVGGSLTYQWKKNGINISGAISATYSIPSVVPADSGRYVCYVLGSCGRDTSVTSVLSVTSPAAITQQPSSLTQACVGSTAVSFTVAATGSSLSYQWRKGTNNIAGAINPTYTLPAVALSDTGSYTCVVTSACGPMTSNVAYLAVYPVTAVTSNPTATQTVCTGSSLSFAVTAVGQTLSYQWKKNSINISGATSAAYNIASASAGDAGSYKCYVTGVCGVDSSTVSVVTVNQGPSITQQPQAQTLCAGTTLNLSVAITGSGLTYQWQKGGVNISGETATTFTRTNTAVSDSGSYVCVITSGCGNLNSQSAHVTLNPIPTASISPATAAVCAGSSIALTASGGGTYTWSNSLGTAAAVNPSPTSATTYSVTVTLNSCTATASRLVTVNALPSITLTPSSSSICPGGSQLLTAGGGSTYTWSNTLGTGGSKTVSPVSQTTYTVSGTDINNCSATASATVTVNPITAISTQPIAQTTCVGGAVVFSVGATGTGLSYQWRKGTVNITGATSATYSIASAVSGDAGSYDVIVTGTCGNATSSAATLTVTGSMQISQQPIAVSSCAGSNAILTVVANGSGISYGWTKNGNAIGASNNDTLYLNNLSANEAGNYICNITSSCGNAASNTVAVTVKAKTFGAISQTVCFGDTYTFNGSALAQSGSYNDTLVNATGCDSILTLNLTVRPRISSTQSAVICNGSSITFNGQTITAAGQYFDTLTSVSSCDSFITMNVTLAQATASSFSYAACGSFTFGGVTLTTGGTYSDTITNVAGCDSVITLTLTINTATSSSIADTICNGASYTFGTQTLSTSGSYTDTLINSTGCDSVVTLLLYVRPALNVSIAQSGLDLTATAGFATYQWELNSNNITGANADLYAATANGDYTVVVTDANNCSATSSALNVTGVGIKDMSASSVSFSLYPNPANEVLNIRCDDKLVSVEISDILGKAVKTLSGDIRKMNIADIASGVYTAKIITTDGKVALKKFTKQ
jgi:hypothetical protein